MGAQGGFGLVFKVHNGTSLATVARVLDAEFPKIKKYLAESTGHDSTGGYYEAVDTGKKRIESFKVTLAWNATDHIDIMTAFSASTPTQASIEDPDGDETLGFSMFVEEIQRMSKQEEVYKAEVTIQPTGTLTIS